MAKRKFYVVWAGRNRGIYDNWDDCLQQIEHYPGAQYKSYSSQQEASLAFRGDNREEADMILQIARHSAEMARQGALAFADIPEINKEAIAVDGACAKNPGPMEYRGVKVGTGEEIFHIGPIDDGTNNVAEYLALVHALALLYNRNDTSTPIYTDSRTARSWVRAKAHRSKLQPTEANQRIFQMLDRADRWLQTHTTQTPILVWDTENWGEIPADFGRK